MHPQEHTAYIICGPTAVGKTSISIQLAQRLGTEILSADSRQCYKEMSIGTAKPDEDELRAVKHHFIDEFSVTEHITVAAYEQYGLNTLEQIFATHKDAVVCGGTGLYIKALCDGIDEMPEADAQIKDEVNQQYKTNGIAWLQETIKQEDPQFYTQGEIQNPVRMLRALSFIRSTGTSLISYHTGTKQQRPFRIVKVGLELPRELLYERINRRVDIMMQQGLMDEAERLYPQKDLKNLQTVGYQELFDLKDGKYSTLQEAVDKIKQHTRNYAKRQMTWFRKDEAVNWYRADDKDVVDKILLL